MRILIAAGLYPPDIGGPATYVKTLEEALPKRGVSVTVVPFSLVRQQPVFIRHLYYMIHLWRASAQADLIYALDPVSVGFPAFLVARVRWLPFVIRLGGDYAWEQGRVRFGLDSTLDQYLADNVKRPLPVRLLAGIQSYVTKRAVAVVAPSQYLKSVIVRWGVTSTKVTVIHSAPLFEPVVETKVVLRERFGYQSPVIISAGRLVPWKGFLTLVKVVAALSSEYKDITLVIVGDGGDAVLIKEEAERLGISTRVQLLGRLSRTELFEHITAADLFVLNTAYEGLSHQLLEVMHSGTPLITTDIEGNTELITSGIEGLLVPFNNEIALKKAIEQLLADAALQKTLAAAAAKKAQLYSGTDMIEEIHNLFKTIV